MQFNSLAFAVFLPLVFIIYWIIPQSKRWIVLLAASYYFYISWNFKYVVLIIFTTLVTYYTAILIEKADARRKKRILLIASLICCLGILFVFKYLTFAMDSITGIMSLFAIKLSLPVLKLLLPLGISYYTFQTIGYVVDVYSGDIKAEKHFGVYAVFVSFFPRLVSGPIEKASNLIPQIRSEKKFDYDLAVYGLRLMLWGFYKKIVVADTLGIYVDKVYTNVHNYKGVDLAFVILFYTIQIYCDFSGYSDIAIGTAKLLGINLMTNFRSPYFSTSIKEFWGRWHISLSTWLKDYVYIPLGGSRCSKARHYLNLMVTFLVSGLWHGANWTFVAWGGMHGLVQIAEDVAKKPLSILKKNKITAIPVGLVVFALCNIGWVFFRADSFSDAFYVISNCLDGIGNFSAYYHNTIGLNKSKYLMIFLSVAVVAVYDYFSLKIDLIEWIKEKPLIVRCLLQYAFIFLVLWIGIDNMGNNTFVYFQF